MSEPVSETEVSSTTTTILSTVTSQSSLGTEIFTSAGASTIEISSIGTNSVSATQTSTHQSTSPTEES